MNYFSFLLPIMVLGTACTKERPMPAPEKELSLTEQFREALIGRWVEDNEFFSFNDTMIFYEDERFRSSLTTDTLFEVAQGDSLFLLRQVYYWDLVLQEQVEYTARRGYPILFNYDKTRLYIFCLRRGPWGTCSYTSYKRIE